jgi:hypothetical protein
MNDDHERDPWHRRPSMTKEEKLEQIRRMKAALQGESTKESNERE